MTHSPLLKRFSELGAIILCGVALSLVSCGGSGSEDKDAGLETDADVTDGTATDALVSTDGHSDSDAGEDGGVEDPQWRDLFMDQSFVVPTNAEVGDVVGLVRLYPTVLDEEPMFSVLDGSPAIDQGVDVGITTDRLGTPIPQGTAPDIGAFEHR